MLTVKHIKLSGCESIHLATEVRYDCGHGEDSIASAPTIWIDTPSGDTQSIGSWGTFFVMNEAGKTVARYNLGGLAGQAVEPAGAPLMPGDDEAATFPLRKRDNRGRAV